MLDEPAVHNTGERLRDAAPRPAGMNEAHPHGVAQRLTGMREDRTEQLRPRPSAKSFISEQLQCSFDSSQFVAPPPNELASEH